MLTSFLVKAERGGGTPTYFGKGGTLLSEGKEKGLSPEMR